MFFIAISIKCNTCIINGKFIMFIFISVQNNKCLSLGNYHNHNMHFHSVDLRHITTFNIAIVYYTKCPWNI